MIRLSQEANELDSVFASACYRGDYEAVQLILSALDRGQDEIKVMINKKNDLGETPLHLASCFNGCILPPRSTNMVRKRDINSPTYAEEFKNIKRVEAFRDVIKLLVERGANIHTINNDGSTVLHYVCIQQMEDVASYLITCGANISLINENGRTALEEITNEDMRRRLIALVDNESKQE